MPSFSDWKRSPPSSPLALHPQSLELFLECRSSYITAQLRPASPVGSEDPSSDDATEQLAQLLCRTATAVHDITAQLGDLFLAPHLDSGVPMLVAKAAGDGVSSSELLFGPLRNAVGEAGVSAETPPMPPLTV